MGVRRHHPILWWGFCRLDRTLVFLNLRLFERVLKVAQSNCLDQVEIQVHLSTDHVARGVEQVVHHYVLLSQATQHHWYNLVSPNIAGAYHLVFGELVFDREDHVRSGPQLLLEVHSKDKDMVWQRVVCVLGVRRVVPFARGCAAWQKGKQIPCSEATPAMTSAS